MLKAEGQNNPKRSSPEKRSRTKDKKRLQTKRSGKPFVKRYWILRIHLSNEPVSVQLTGRTDV